MSGSRNCVVWPDVRFAVMGDGPGEAGKRAVNGRSWSTICAELVGHYRRTISTKMPVPLP